MGDLGELCVVHTVTPPPMVEARYVNLRRGPASVYVLILFPSARHAILAFLIPAATALFISESWPAMRPSISPLRAHLVALYWEGVVGNMGYFLVFASATIKTFLSLLVVGAFV